MVSNVIKSDENITVKGLNQALEYFGIKQLTNHINDVQAQEISVFLLHKFSSVCNLKNIRSYSKCNICWRFGTVKKQLKFRVQHLIQTLTINQTFKTIRNTKIVFRDISEIQLFNHLFNQNVRKRIMSTVPLVLSLWIWLLTTEETK